MTRPPLSAFVIVAGAGILAVGGVVSLRPWVDAARWEAAPEAARAQRNADAPTPIWVTPTPRVARPAVAPTSVLNPSTSVPTPTAQTVALDISVAPAFTPTPTASDLELTAAAFEFVDAPEPGAAARLTLSIHNPTDHSSGPISVSVPLSWLGGYRIQATDPSLLDGTQTATELRLGFGAAEPLSNADFSIDVVAIDEVIDSPVVTLFDGDGRLIGQAHPPTQAPPSRPGPIYSIDIPRLKLHTGVVPVEWEPPLFVVGQVRASAFVSLGNSVLVGHVRGAPGYNIFDRLDQLAPGDQVIANSRGQPYNFVVSETQVLPQDDTSPTMPTASPRLTLMTCTGDWNPLTQNYPDRLWVIAEPDGPTEATQPRPPEPRRLRAVQ